MQKRKDEGRQMQFEIAACTDVGTRKKVNQDSLYAGSAQTKLGIVTMSVICDGVGGLACGEIASSKTVYIFKRWFWERLPQLIEKGMVIQDIEKEWRRLITQINEEIVAIGEKKGMQMGTTLTAAIFIKGDFLVTQVGDSRFYEIGNGQLHQITRDQTLVEREVQQGHLTREQALTDSRRHVLLQCIGLNEKVEPEFLYGKQSEYANYLFCTDGFYNTLLSKELYDYCGVKGRKEELERQLNKAVEICKCRGEKDNISAVLLGA